MFGNGQFTPVMPVTRSTWPGVSRLPLTAVFVLRTYTPPPATSSIVAEPNTCVHRAMTTGSFPISTPPASGRVVRFAPYDHQSRQSLYEIDTSSAFANRALILMYGRQIFTGWARS